MTYNENSAKMVNLTINTYIKTQKGSQTNNLNLQLKDLEKEHRCLDGLVC